MTTKKLLTVFAATENRDEWVEYTVSIKKTGKTNKPFKLNATLAWRSSNKVSAVAAVRGSYETNEKALSQVREIAEEYGRTVVDMAHNDLSYISDRFGYPLGRSSYLIEKAII